MESGMEEWAWVGEVGAIEVGAVEDFAEKPMVA